MEDFQSIIFKLADIENRINMPLGYYWYTEQDTSKVIYVFGEYKFTDTERYYYYDFSEMNIRSFQTDNSSFADRTKRITDLDTVKVYDMLLEKEMKALVSKYSTLIKMMRKSLT